MQATRFLSLNRRHPDAAGCFCAIPNNGYRIDDVAARKAGNFAWTGTPTYANMQNGVGMSFAAGRNIAGQYNPSPWTTAFSVCVRLMTTSIATAGSVFGVGGVLLRSNTTALYLTDDPVTANSGACSAISNNVEYVIGVRWQATDNVPHFFVNGVRSAVAALALTPSAKAFTIGASASGVNWPGTIRDFRMWNRWMPDATFERYYTKPQEFYVTRRVGLKGALAFNAGRFFPFLHPALQS